MAVMIDIAQILLRTDSLIHIYKERVVLNKEACNLLGIKEGDRVLVRRSLVEARAGRERIYMAKGEAPSGYIVHGRYGSGRINSAPLARILASLLQGYGTYRLCPEVNVEVDGRTYYEIFFRKY